MTESLRPSSINARDSMRGLLRSTGVEIPTPGAGATYALKSVCSIVELLRLGVQRCALLDGSEASNLQSLASLLHGLHPWVLLALRALLLAHNLAALVLVQVLGSQAADGLLLAATEHHGLCTPALRNLAHGLLLHGLHRLHGLHGSLLLHHLHCLHGLHGSLLLHHLHGLHGLHGSLLLHHFHRSLHGLHGSLLLHHLRCRCLHGLHCLGHYD